MIAGGCIWEMPKLRLQLEGAVEITSAFHFSPNVVVFCSMRLIWPWVTMACLHFCQLTTAGSSHLAKRIWTILQVPSEVPSEVPSSTSSLAAQALKEQSHLHLTRIICQGKCRCSIRDPFVVSTVGDQKFHNFQVTRMTCRQQRCGTRITARSIYWGSWFQ